MLRCLRKKTTLFFDMAGSMIQIVFLRLNNITILAFVGI
jgi:hypothetical protein